MLNDGQHRTSFGAFGTAHMCRLYTTDFTFSVSCELSQPMGKTISILHVCMVWTEKSVTRALIGITRLAE